MIEAVASAMPSITPTVRVDAPSTPTRYSGSSAWIISEETSISSETSPSAQMLAGISRQRRKDGDLSVMCSPSFRPSAKRESRNP